MPITYTRYVHRKPEPDPFSTTFEDLEEDVILLFDPVLEGTTIGPGELYRRLDLGLRASDVVVFRGADSTIIQALQADPLLHDNLVGKKVLALIGAPAGENSGPVFSAVPGFSIPDNQPQLENIRQAELTAILQRSQAIFTSNDYHYELPSGLHAEKFVRLGDALRSVFDIRRITDWVIPYLNSDTVIIADTGSLLPLLLDIREQARARFGWQVEISTLDRYPQDNVAVADAIAAIRNRPMVADASTADADLGFLFLISVNSSGRLSRLFRTVGPANATIVVLCETSPSEMPRHDGLVSVPVTCWDVTPDGRCDQCEASPLIRVHPESYELLPSINRDTIIVGKQLAEEGAPFWTMVDAADAVQLHVNVPYTVNGQEDYRHFSIFLDTEKLAAHADFRQLCLERLANLRMPDLVLIPEHNTSSTVVDLCQEAYPDVDVCVIPPGRFRDDTQRRLEGAQRLLVADDAIVTGTTLLNLRTELFRVTQGLSISPEVNVFAIVCRPSSEVPLLAIRRRYRGSTVSKI